METTSRRSASPFRIWLLPFSLLLGTAVLVFVLTFLVDTLDEESPGRIWRLIVHPNADSALGALSNAAEVVAAVLGIAITVVAIVVELASNRYTHRITELFVSEPINFVVMGFFVVTALQCLAVSIVFDMGETAEVGFVPYFSASVSMAMLGLSLVILLPYFAFVFSFLNPIEIVERIRRHTLDVVASRSGAWTVQRKQREAVRGIEQLADVALNAMEHKDKGVSMASADALRSLILDYQKLRPALRDEWYAVEGDLAVNPDFVSMAPGVLESVSDRRIWLEMKVLRQYQTLYNEALNRMRDMNYLIAINTRLIAEAGLEKGNRELFDLAVKFFNTYLRATVNAKDVRTAYNVLNQYRLLAEHVLDHDDGRQAVEIARYFKYYGGVSFNAKLPFILETVAYDLCTLNELAYDEDSPSARELLRIFLQVDRESESEVQETSLRGVRKAQVKLATFYLLKGDEELAREVFQDMSSERPERLASIRNELLAIRSSEFWEISDRGVNFDYLPPKRKRRMLEFFGWFGDRLPPLPERISSEVAQDSNVPASSSAGTERATDSSEMVAGIGIGSDVPPGQSRPN
ncbi:MAG TPA: DUF2254 family protein [Sandaracinaceae bacterium LLY-WYZ-13_1]|nr:DUF2254 family protein [Sandaracinaceae bacterium LLY-WYZ-13_1]